MDTAAIRAVSENNEDFGHEMRVGAMLAAAGASNIRHGQTYVDPVTGKVRQFDYRFDIRGRETNKALFCAAECKNVQTNNPVIVCGYRRIETEAFHEVIASRFGRYKVGNRMFFQTDSSTTARTSVATAFGRGLFVGKSIIRGGGSARQNEGEVFDKWTQALSSANDVVKDAMSAAKPTGGGVFLSVVLPIVVFPDKTLWTASFDQDGKLDDDPKQTDCCHFFVGQRYTREAEAVGIYHPYLISHISFFTIAGLNIFLRSFAPDSLKWEEWIPRRIVDTEPFNMP